MKLGLFKKRELSEGAKPPRVDATKVVYAIGDIHGRYDLLYEMLQKIRADCAKDASKRPVVIFLGDYIDRGPMVSDVIYLILKLMKDSAFEIRTLKGNHEEALLNFLEDPASGGRWISYGASETLSSYGVEPPKAKAELEELTLARDQLLYMMPKDHMKFFQDLETFVELGDYFFVHAGVKPKVALEDQSEHDMLWIRDEFLKSSFRWEKTIVHGHTPMEEPFVSSWRISLDTGAYATGVLTAIRLAGESQSLIQAGVR